MTPLETLNIQKLQTLIELLQSITSKEGRIKRLETCDYTGSDLLKNGTDIEKDGPNGVFVTKEELKVFINYFEECKTNGEAKDMIVSIYTHSNNNKLNNSIGLCDYKDADFAEVVVQTSEYFISMKINYKQLMVENGEIISKLGHYVKVDKVQWRKLEDIRNKPNRREVLLNRLIYSFASIYEMDTESRVSSKDEMIHILNRTSAIELKELTDLINQKGYLNSTKTMKVLNVTFDNEMLNIMKFIYNKIKNDSLRLTGSGAVNDKTYCSFECDGTELDVEVSMNKLVVGIRVK